MQNLRIKTLDSFRAIAILMVLFFHFFSRWTAIYPYGATFDYFKLGKFGVHFFFIISGFVILYTLEKTTSFRNFWTNRFIRLFPSMLIASSLTLLFCLLFDNNNLFPTSHLFKNLIVSCTFLPPDLVSLLFQSNCNLDYISGSYWSLWPEIQFYVLISTTYFCFKKNFTFILLSLCTILIIFGNLLSHCYLANEHIMNLKKILTVFNLITPLPYFVLGIIFYELFKSKQHHSKINPMIKFVFVFLIGVLWFQNDYNLAKMTLIITFISLFICLIYCPKKISFLDSKYIQNIGVSSYFLYLIHENIGVLIIQKSNEFDPKFQLLIPLTVLVILIILSVFYTQIIEKKIHLFLKKKPTSP